MNILMLDGPQAWKSEDNGYPFCRASESELNTSAKTGLPGTVLPGTYERFVGFCLALYDALERLGAVRRFARLIERFSYSPIDSSLTIAKEIASRFAASKANPSARRA